MPGKALQIVFRNVIAKIVQQQERIEFRCVAEAEGAAQMHAGPFHRWLSFDETFDGTNGHKGLAPGFNGWCIALLAQRARSQCRIALHPRGPSDKYRASCPWESSTGTKMNT